jgi:hypothetical protein
MQASPGQPTNDVEVAEHEFPAPSNVSDPEMASYTLTLLRGQQLRIGGVTVNAIDGEVTLQILSVDAPVLVPYRPEGV